MAGSSSGGGGGGRKPKRPPVGGGASRASPFAPPQAPPRKKRREIGNRAPDETGMLSMVPLSDDEDQDEVAHDPSATAFFALPPPKAAARNSVPPAPPAPGMNPHAPPAAPPRPGGMMAPPPAMPQMGGAPPRPGFAAAHPPPVASHMGAGGPPPPAIQGPVASQGMVQGSATSPFKVTPQAPPPPANDAGRVKNYTMYVVVIGLAMLVCVAVMAALWFAPKGGEPGPTPNTAPAVTADVGNKPPTKRRRSAPQDTGDVEEEKEPEKPAPSSKKRRSSSSTKRTSSAPKAPAAPKGGTLTVKLTDPSVSSSIIVTCPSGFSRKVAFSGGVASVPGVPPEGCKVSFKGGSPAVYSGARGGQTLTCSPAGSLPNCR